MVRACLYSSQLVVNHHGRPTNLDLDCAEELRCPLLRFPLRSWDPSTGPTAERRRDDNATDGEAGGDALPDVDSMQPGCGDRLQGDQGAASNLTASSGGSRKDLTDDGQGTNAPKNDSDGEDGSFPARSGPSSDACIDGNGANNNDNADDDVLPQHRPIGGGVDSVGLGETKPHHHDEPQHQEKARHQRHHQRQHHGALVPARLVAVLVDGSGKGWMAARRLWSVHEVGHHALALAGLTAGDVDREQEVS